MGPIIITASTEILPKDATATFNSVRTVERSLKNWAIPASTRVQLIVIYCATHGRDLTDDMANKTVSAARCNMEGIVFFLSNATTCPYRLCAPPPTSEVWAPMGRSYVAPMMWVVIYERGVPGGALILSSTNYPEQGHHGELPLLEKIPTAGPGIEPRNSRLVVSSLDHQAMKLVTWKE
jgi:hypothetical protein